MEATRVRKWRTLFESNLPPIEEREDGEQYEFGHPASDAQLMATEQVLGVRLPPEVRELLSEFNGVWCTTTFDRQIGCDPEILYLDTKHMSVDVPKYFAHCEGNPLPVEADLRKVVFVAQSNGFGDLWGVCTSRVEGHKPGAVVRLDHEVGNLEASHPSLAAFVCTGFK